MMTVVYMDNDDIYQLFIKHDVKGVRREVARLAIGVNLGDAGVIGEALQTRFDPSAGQRALQAGEPGLQAGEQAAGRAGAGPQAEQAQGEGEAALAAPLADNNDALAAPLAEALAAPRVACFRAAPLEQQEPRPEAVPKAWPVYEVPQQLRDADLEIALADRQMVLKRKRCEMSDLDHQQSEKQEHAKLKLAAGSKD